MCRCHRSDRITLYQKFSSHLYATFPPFARSLETGVAPPPLFFSFHSNLAPRCYQRLLMDLCLCATVAR